MSWSSSGVSASPTTAPQTTPHHIPPSRQVWVGSVGWPHFLRWRWTDGFGCRPRVQERWQSWTGGQWHAAVQQVWTWAKANRRLGRHRSLRCPKIRLGLSRSYWCGDLWLSREGPGGALTSGENMAGSSRALTSGLAWGMPPSPMRSRNASGAGSGADQELPDALSVASGAFIPGCCSFRLPHNRATNHARHSNALL